MAGAAGNDQLFGEAGNDILSGGSGSDYLNGGGGDDRLRGNADSDLFAASRGVDVVEDFHGAATGEGDRLLFDQVFADYNDFLGHAF